MSSSQVHGVSPGELQAAQHVDALRREGEGEVEMSVFPPPSLPKHCWLTLLMVLPLVWPLFRFAPVYSRWLISLRSISDFWPVHRAVVDGSSMLSLNDELVGGGLDVRTMSDKRRKGTFALRLFVRQTLSTEGSRQELTARPHLVWESPALFLAQLEPRSLASRKAFVGAYIKQPRSTTDDTARQDRGGLRVPAGYALFELPPTFSPLADDRDEVEETLLGEFGKEEKSMDVEYVARRARELEAVWESVLEGREHWFVPSTLSLYFSSKPTRCLTTRWVIKASGPIVR